MGYPASVLKVLIASPGDVSEERKIITEEIHRWNDAHAASRKIILQPVKWETHSTPRLGQPAQAELNEQIADDADILIGIFGTRIGTATERHMSGTVEEIKNHVAAGKSAKVYFSDVPVHPSAIDQGQYQAVQAFKEECKSWGLYATYSDIQGFQRDVKQHLDIELNAPRYLILSSRQAAGTQAGQKPSPDALQLLTMAVQGKGKISAREFLTPDAIVVENLAVTDGSPRSLARWMEALNQLKKLNMVEENRMASGQFEVTEAGYSAVEREEDAKPTKLSARVAGKPDAQELEIISSRIVKLVRIEYLHSTEACIASQPVDVSGQEVTVRLDTEKVGDLVRSSRPDKSHHDHSGPAKLRLVVEIGDDKKQVILPVHLEPKFVANTQWFTLIGNADATL
jgi:hypothetical protein